MKIQGETSMRLLIRKVCRYKGSEIKMLTFITTFNYTSTPRLVKIRILLLILMDNPVYADRIIRHTDATEINKTVSAFFIVSPDIVYSDGNDSEGKIVERKQ